MAAFRAVPPPSAPDTRVIKRKLIRVHPTDFTPFMAEGLASANSMMVGRAVDTKLDLAPSPHALTDARVARFLETHLTVAHVAKLDTRAAPISVTYLGIIGDPRIPVPLSCLWRCVEQM